MSISPRQETLRWVHEVIRRISGYFYLKVTADCLSHMFAASFREPRLTPPSMPWKLHWSTNNVSPKTLFISKTYCFVTYSRAKWSRDSSTALFTIWTLKRKRVKMLPKYLHPTFCHFQLFKMCSHWLSQHKLLIKSLVSTMTTWANQY